ncbi:hypothetical protein GOP47_0013018 [Adiantum capillus-veneris]|uniref:Pentatricopeptide repeat-containing protein n=1 Tax=Adiantum capillus-veneris TaxID=13818 RepID=A0A9D4USW9_ADICA|nr:hypothetical protein GOP47_0013018 [Adiantum capillus-veneris]
MRPSEPWMAINCHSVYNLFHSKLPCEFDISLWLLRDSSAWLASGRHLRFGRTYAVNALLEDDRSEPSSALHDSIKGKSSFPIRPVEHISKQLCLCDTSRLSSLTIHNFTQALHCGTSGKAETPSFPFSPSDLSFILQQCGHNGLLSGGKIAHDHIVRNGYEQIPFISNCLGYMYGNCGALLDARAIFIGMHNRDVYSWNFLIRAYALQEQVREALNLFHQMELSGTYPDKFSFISILFACENLVEGALLHVSVIEHESERDVLVGNALISFYGRCGSLEDAQQNFNLMERKDLVSWNTIIAVYAQYGEVKMAFILFNTMKQENVTPDRITFITLLSASANDVALFEGQYMHTLVLDSEFASDVSVGNALINMYGKCGLCEDAWSIFREMRKKDIISWNAIITAYANNHDGERAFQLFKFLQLEGLAISKVSLVAVLEACACEGSLAEGQRMHAFAMNVGLFSDVVVAGAVVHMYSKSRSLSDAYRAFQHLSGRTLLTWNTIIAAYSQCQQGSSALSMHGRMLCEGVLPDHVTLVSVVSACTKPDTIFDAKCLHAVAIASNVWGDIGVGTSLVHIYGKHGLLEEAEKLFCRLLAVNLVTWNALLAAYAQCELLDRVKEFCSLMYLQGILPDNVTFLSTLSACTHPNDLAVGKQTHTRILWSTCKADALVVSALVNMYGKCNALINAQKIFESNQHHNVSCWNALLGAYSQNGYGMFSFELFHRMQWEGVIADKVTFISILRACTMEITEGDVFRLHTYLLGNNIGPDIALGSAFINTYGKLGKPKDALKMFLAGPKHEVDTWNALITVFGQSGYGNESLQLYFNMQRDGIKPNAITYVSLLSACSHAGLIAKGCCCFILLIADKAISPKAEHYNCMVDLFGRAGRLAEAEYMVNKMPFDPMIIPLLILLAACKHQMDVRRAERVTHFAFIVDPDDPTPYIMLRNIYSTL